MPPPRMSYGPSRNFSMMLFLALVILPLFFEKFLFQDYRSTGSYFQFFFTFFVVNRLWIQKFLENDNCIFDKLESLLCLPTVVYLI